MLNYNKGRHKICIWWFYCFNLSGGGEMMVGCCDPSHPSTPHHHSLDSNHRSPAASCGQGFSKQQHLAPWQAEQAASWITSESPLALTHGKRARGLSGLLCPCLSQVCLWQDMNLPPQSLLLVPPLTRASPCLLLPSNNHFQISQVEIWAPQATCLTHTEGWPQGMYLWI